MMLKFILGFALAASHSLAVTVNEGQCEVDVKCSNVPTGSGGKPACPQTKFNFPTGRQTSNHIRYKREVPTITHLSVCVWATPIAGGDPTMVSYATRSYNNMFIIMIQGGKFKVYKGSAVEFSFTITTRTHVCVTLSTQQRIVTVYLNGIRQTQKTFSDDHPIDGGGALFIGQEQDSVAGKFDSNQAYNGEIENLMMWYRVLNPAEITMMYNNKCACAAGYDVALIPEWIQLEGAVTAVPPGPC